MNHNIFIVQPTSHYSRAETGSVKYLLPFPAIKKIVSHYFVKSLSLTFLEDSIRFICGLFTCCLSDSMWLMYKRNREVLSRICRPDVNVPVSLRLYHLQGCVLCIYPTPNQGGSSSIHSF